MFRKNVLLGIVVVCWAGLVIAGLGVLWAYSTTPGPAADAKLQWPPDSHVVRVAGRPTLIVLLHPQCACSSATVGELARLMAHAPRPITVHALMYQPGATGSKRSRP